MIYAEAARQAAAVGRINNEAARVAAEEQRVSETSTAVIEAGEATKKANEIAEIVQKKLDNGEFNGASGDFSTAGLTVDCSIDTQTYVLTGAIKAGAG